MRNTNYPKRSRPLPRLRLFGIGGVAFLAGLCLTGGCQQGRRAPEPSVGPPPPVVMRVPTRDPIKPLPDARRADPPPPPFVDEPLLSPPLPEQREYVRAYQGVDRPRIGLFVNRSLDGAMQQAGNLPPPDTFNDSARRGQDSRRSDPWHDDRQDVYLPRGEYDEAHAKSIDYETVENVLTNWLSANGQVTIVSPNAIRARLSDAEATKLQEGRPRELREIAKELDADVLVLVRARPTRQTQHGLEIRLVAEAINVLGGESIARATVLTPPPLDSQQINRYTRYVARRLMEGMTETWSGPGPSREGADANARDRATAGEASPSKQTPRRTERQDAVPPIAPRPPAEVQPATPSQPRLDDGSPSPSQVSPPSEPAPAPPSPSGAIPPERPSVLDRDPASVPPPGLDGQ